MSKHIQCDRSPRTPQPHKHQHTEDDRQGSSTPVLGYMPSIPRARTSCSTKDKGPKTKQLPLQFSLLAAEFSRQAAPPLASAIIDCGCEGGTAKTTYGRGKHPQVRTAVDAAGRPPSLGGLYCTVPYVCPPGTSRYPPLPPLRHLSASISTQNTHARRQWSLRLVLSVS